MKKTLLKFHFILLFILSFCGHALAAISTQNLLLHFNFDENITDHSPAGHDTHLGCSLSVDPTYGNGFNGKSYLVDPQLSSPCVIVNPKDKNGHVDLEGMDELSVTAWVKKGTPNAEGTFLNKSFYSGQVLPLYSFGLNSNGLKIYLRTTEAIAQLSLVVDNNDTDWHHYAFTYNGTDLNVYMDGVLIKTEELGGAVRLGSNPIDLLLASFSTDLLAASYDELTLYSRALSASEILEMASVPLPPQVDFSMSKEVGTVPMVINFDASSSQAGSGQIISYEWDFGDGSIGSGRQPTHTYTKDGYFSVKLTVTNSANRSNTTEKSIRSMPVPVDDHLLHLNFDDNVFDWSGHNRFVSPGCVVGPKVSFGDGYLAQAMRYSSGLSNPCIMVNPIGMSGIPQLTLMGWAKKESSSSSGYLFYKNEFKLEILSNGIKGNVLTDKSVDVSATGGNNDTDWHHYALTYDGQAVKLFMDGQQVASQPQTKNINNPAQPANLLVGKIGNAILYGFMDELHIFNRALSLSEIQVFADVDVSIPKRNLSVSKIGTGIGTVSGPGINCGSDCSETYDDGTSVTLTASPQVESEFVGWSEGSCGAALTCTVQMTQARSVSASFRLKDAPPPTQYLLSISRDGAGTGTVLGPGISCGSDCSESFDEGSTITLSANPNSQSEFDRWSLSSCGTSLTCSVSMTRARTISVTFSKKTPLPSPQYSLSIVHTGSGEGKVTGHGFDCGFDCTEIFDEGTLISLSATAEANSEFKGWSYLSCGESSICNVLLNDHTVVQAQFDKVVLAPPPQESNMTNTSNLIHPGRGSVSKIPLGLTEPGSVSFVVYNRSGEIVFQKSFPQMAPGSSLEWAGVNNAQEYLSSGIYHGIIQTPNGTIKTKLVITK